MKQGLGLYTELDQDETADLFARKLRRREQFAFVRYGDGAIECINRLGRGRTIDGENYSPQLGKALKLAWRQFMECRNVYVGDWLSASFGNDRATEYREQYASLIGNRKPSFVHFEGLLLMRTSEALADFYRAARVDPRRKLYMGPAECGPGAELLGARFFEVPMQMLFEQIRPIIARLQQIDFDVFYWGAGMSGSIAAGELLENFPSRTFVNLGSALDPLYRGTTRKTQLSKADAVALLGDLL